MVLDWQQSNGFLLASGDVRVVRVWDAHRELCLQVRGETSWFFPFSMCVIARISPHMLQVASRLSLRKQMRGNSLRLVTLTDLFTFSIVD